MQDKELLINKILIISFILVLILPSFFFQITGHITMKIVREEKRILAAMPEARDADFLKKFGEYFNDHAPYRQEIITINNVFNQKCIEYYDRYISRKLFALLIPDWYKETDDYKHNIPYFVSAYHPHVIFGKENWKFMRGLNCLRNYKGQNQLSNEQMAEWKALYEKLDGCCRKRGINLVVMIVPNKSHVFSEYMPPYKIITENKREIALSNYLKENSTINFLYPLNELKEAGKLHLTYWKQDSHWNYFGSYIGATCLYKKLNLPIIPVEQLNITETTDSGGDLSYMTGDMNPYPDYIVDYKPDVECKILKNTDSFYAASIDKAKSNGRKIIMLGDSYMKYLYPYITKDFVLSEFFLLRAFEDNEMLSAINELENGDVLFLESSERYDEKEHIPTVKRLIKLMSN